MSDPRCRNKRSSVPDWIDAALYEFIHTGRNLSQTLDDFFSVQGFMKWCDADPEKKSARVQAIRNRFKYLRTMHATKGPKFVAAFRETTSPPARTPPNQTPLSARPPTSSPPSARTRLAEVVEPTTEERSRAAVHFELRSNSASSSSSSFVDTEPSTMSIIANRNTSSMMLDFDRPENNPKGLYPIRNRNFTFQNMVVDKVELFWFLADIRDAIYTTATIGRDGNFIIKEPRIPAFMRTNVPDCHFGDDEDPVCEQAHAESIARMRNNRMNYREHTFQLPQGVSIRTTPFSSHPAQVYKAFKETTMDFGQVDENDLPVLHDTFWLKFIFAINRPTDENTDVISDEINNLATRFNDSLAIEPLELPRFRIPADPPAQEPVGYGPPPAAPAQPSVAAAPAAPANPPAAPANPPAAPANPPAAPANPPAAPAGNRFVVVPPLAAVEDPTSPPSSPKRTLQLSPRQDDDDDDEPKSPKKPRQDDK